MGAPYPEPHERDAAMQFIARMKLWNEVAARCGILPDSVRFWRRVPRRRLPMVERAIGWPRREIRPDLYPQR